MRTKTVTMTTSSLYSILSLQYKLILNSSTENLVDQALFHAEGMISAYYSLDLIGSTAHSYCFHRLEKARRLALNRIDALNGFAVRRDRGKSRGVVYA